MSGNANSALVPLPATSVIRWIGPFSISAYGALITPGAVARVEGLFAHEHQQTGRCVIVADDTPVTVETVLPPPPPPEPTVSIRIESRSREPIMVDGAPRDQGTVMTVTASLAATLVANGVAVITSP